MVELCKEAVVPGEWLVARTSTKGKTLVQLINLGANPILLSNHATLGDLYIVPCHCFKLLLKQLDIHFRDYLLLLHQLLEKHLLFFTASPEDYSFPTAIDHPVHVGDSPPIQE